ncbi:MAG: substrate-binding domain-containing protein [Butyrivibrio sp.]|nr:substrate-binding domain-containing protein [Butyrivibrio sp.]
MKNKLFCFMLIALLGLFLTTGCASYLDLDKSDMSNTSSLDSSYAKTRIGVCIYQLNDNFMSLFCDELVNYLVSLGFSEDNIIVFGSSNNQAVQLTQVEELIDRGVDALIVNPVNSAIVHTITDKAVNNGIPLVYINREPSADEEANWEEYDLSVTYVGCDARQSGIYQGELLAGLGGDTLDINGDGAIQYYMIEGAPENIDAGFRTLYSLSTLTNSGFKMDCLLDEVGNWDKATSKLITAKGISQNLIPEVIICNNDAMALGAIDAVKEAGLTPGRDVYIVGVDALPEAIEEVKNGTMVGTVFNDYIGQSHNAADAALRYLNGEENEHYIGCEYVKVSSSNAQQVLELIQSSDTDEDANVEYKQP